MTFENIILSEWVTEHRPVINRDIGQIVLQPFSFVCLSIWPRTWTINTGFGQGVVLMCPHSLVPPGYILPHPLLRFPWRWFLRLSDPTCGQSASPAKRHMPAFEHESGRWPGWPWGSSSAQFFASNRPCQELLPQLYPLCGPGYSLKP